MKCPNCGSNLTINSKGILECPVCSNIERKIEATRIRYNDFEFFKVIKAENITSDMYLLADDIEDLVKKGVKIVIKQEK